jgi:hypothetical protein
MATLYQKIKEIHPSLTSNDFDPFEGTISLRNDTGKQSDDYIAKWEHPTLTKPTQSELDAV